MGVPGCPLLAFCTASMASVRMVLMQSCSSFCCSVASLLRLAARRGWNLRLRLLGPALALLLGYSPVATFLLLDAVCAAALTCNFDNSVPCHWLSCGQKKVNRSGAFCVSRQPRYPRTPFPAKSAWKPCRAPCSTRRQLQCRRKRRGRLHPQQSSGGNAADLPIHLPYFD